ncbi:site-specific DNA-methyltransferase [Patescibacteria group bacterium]|nr:site-specific DNA-methyltransferase [Patescibacteria group bacterium]MBU4017056.1 site-specific DNA-methyltransferase [Patescibacteria group bacterium]MBU4098739.1 site-specific DNA-methyltransferase [Patescibacteria group bacterium]
MQTNLITIKEASDWASQYLSREISASNISYLIQYGKIKKHQTNGSIHIDIDDLKKYYLSFIGNREIHWKEKLGKDLNWALSFDYLREKDTTKHVHRLHPYKGKFIPQLVQYFLDNHVDEFKTHTYFNKGGIILDPFAGSGTTLVQANELGLHSIGIDISRFNCLISEVKLHDYDFLNLEKEIRTITSSVTTFEAGNNIKSFENELYSDLNLFNTKYFPSPNFKYKVYRKEIDEDKYGREKDKEFLVIYNQLIQKYNIRLIQNMQKTFLDKWYITNIRKEIDYAFGLIKNIKDTKNKRILAIILSRAIRSCRATTHSDLATLKSSQTTTYYCFKHKKICKPIFSIKGMFNKYANDSLFRLKDFTKLKTDAFWHLQSDDSRTVSIFEKIKERNKKFYELLQKQKISGIFTSPPYVGQIDYHEQHAYSYDLMGFNRKDELEIGPLYKGQGIDARKSYIKGISDVLINCKKYLAPGFNIFIVANDKYNLYPAIAEQSGLKIVNKFKRPVLNRTERDKSPYSEIIFHLK